MTNSPNSSLSLRLTLPNGKRGIATLQAAKDAPAGTLAPLARSLAKSGMIAVPDITEGGGHMLRVSGFKRTEDITKILAQQPIKVQISRSAPEKKNIKTWLRENSLRISGYIYLIADASLILAGLTDKKGSEGRFKEALTGAGWALGGITSARYGHPTLSKQVMNVGIGLHDFLVGQGAVIPQGSALKHIREHHSGVGSSVERFLYRYPSEVHNGIYAGFAAFSLFPAGLEKYRKNKGINDKKSLDGMMNMASGALVTAGGLVGGFVKERQDAQDSGVWHWIKERPLRLAAWLYMLNNFTGIGAGLARWKDPQERRSAFFKIFTGLVFIVANTFMAITSRGHTSAGRDEKTKQSIIEGLVAETIAAQPESLRPSLIRQVAGFLSSQPETKQDMQGLIVKLEHKVNTFCASPWHQGSAELIASDPVIPEPPATSNLFAPWKEKVRPALVPQPAMAGLGV